MDIAAFIIASVSFLFTLWLTWETKLKVGKLVLSTPLVQGVQKAPDRGCTFILPLAFHNVGARTVVVGDIQLSIAGPDGYTGCGPWREARSSLARDSGSGTGTLADGHGNLPAPFVVRPQEGHLVNAVFAFADFDLDVLSPGKYEAEIRVLASDEWVSLLRFDVDALAAEDQWHNLRDGQGFMLFTPRPAT